MHLVFQIVLALCIFRVIEWAGKTFIKAMEAGIEAAIKSWRESAPRK